MTLSHRWDAATSMVLEDNWIQQLEDTADETENEHLENVVTWVSKYAFRCVVDDAHLGQCRDLGQQIRV